MSGKKKVNTALFVVAATLVNIVLIAVSSIILTFLLGLLARHVQLSDTVYSVLVALDFILSFVFSLLIYRKLVALAVMKWDIGERKVKKGEGDAFSES